MTELERKALLGDREAQRLCTEQGIVLPCPRCGEAPVEKAFIGAGKFYFECNCGSATFCYDRKEKALLEWNTRSAPPVGRCGECKYYKLVITRSGSPKKCQHPLSGLYRILSENDFCSYFEPKGDKENA